MAIDPGSEKSGYVLLQCQRGDVRLVNWGHESNDNVDELASRHGRVGDDAHLVVEQTIRYTMSPGISNELLDTSEQIGRFRSTFGYHDAVVMHRAKAIRTLCGTSNAGAPQVRAAILDIWGGKEKAIGKKKAPGPLYGVKGRHVWDALALGLAYLRILEEQQND